MNKLQARDLGSYPVARRVETLQKTIKNCDNRHSNQNVGNNYGKAILRKRYNIAYDGY